MYVCILILLYHSSMSRRNTFIYSFHRAPLWDCFVLILRAKREQSSRYSQGVQKDEKIAPVCLLLCQSHALCIQNVKH